MQLIKAIVRPDKVDVVKDALGALSISGNDRHRGARPRQAEGPHRHLPRQREQTFFLKVMGGVFLARF